MRRTIRHARLLGAWLLASAAHGDPLQSVLWPQLQRQLLGAAPVVFDARVTVDVPRQVEDGQRVPVSIDASALGAVEELLLIADYNPLPLALRLHPLRVRPTLALALRVNQATPLRAAARTADGVWHVGGALVDAPGGGCALPTPTRASTDWANVLGRIYGRLWRDGDGRRLRLRLMHPMDTGLVAGVPSFHLSQLQLDDAAGNTLARLELHAPLAENPLLTLRLDSGIATPLRVAAADSDGNRFHALLPELP